MYIPSGMDVEGNPLPYQDGDNLAYFPTIGNMATDAFADACILPVEYDQPNSSKYIPGYDELPVTYNDSPEEDEDIFIIDSKAVEIFDEYRILPISSPDFWTIHAIGAFELLNNIDKILAYAPHQLHSSIILFGDHLEQARKEWVDAREGRQLSLPMLLEWSTLHEIGHTFGLGHTGEGSVMMFGNPVPMYVVGRNQVFLVEQIVTIQSQANPV